MSLFKRPLVALSLTAPDAGLLRYAARVLPVEGCEEVRFVHVVADRHAAPVEAELQDIRARLQSEVEAAFRTPAVRMVFDVVHGARLDQLLALAVEHQSDVILLGHRKSRSGLRSLARRLAMVAPCSVWLVPEGARDRLTRILVPVDFSSHSADALGVATSLAAENGRRECLAVHVYFDPSTVRYDEHVDEVFGHEQAAFETLLAATDCHGVRVEPVLEESTRVPEAILRVSQERSCDLIVMNTRGRSRSAAVLLGSVTSETMAATTVPLLAVKHFGSRMTLMQALLNHRFWEEPSPKSN
jgi:nucleotide-binding universal stress UspA family protein